MQELPRKRGAEFSAVQSAPFRGKTFYLFFSLFYFFFSHFGSLFLGKLRSKYRFVSLLFTFFFLIFFTIPAKPFSGLCGR